MRKDGPEGKNPTERETETAVPDRARSRTRTTQAECQIKDTLEDDEVREALKLYREGEGA